MTKNELEVQVADQQEYIARLEALLLPFEAFKPHLKAAEVQRRAAVDIGINTARLRSVVELCDEIHARENAKVVTELEAADDV